MRPLIPAPSILRRYVSASDPSIDTEEVDAVGFTAEHPLPLLGQAQPQSREDLSVAERWWRWQGIALLRLDETHRPAAERRESSIKPGVAEERRVLEPLRLDERRRWSARVCRDRLQRMPLGSREPVRERRQLREESAQRGGD